MKHNGMDLKGEFLGFKDMVSDIVLEFEKHMNNELIKIEKENKPVIQPGITIDHKTFSELINTLSYGVNAGTVEKSLFNKMVNLAQTQVNTEHKKAGFNTIKETRDIKEVSKENSKNVEEVVNEINKYKDVYHKIQDEETTKETNQRDTRHDPTFKEVRQFMSDYQKYCQDNHKKPEFSKPRIVTIDDIPNFNNKIDYIRDFNEKDKAFKQYPKHCTSCTEKECASTKENKFEELSEEDIMNIIMESIFGKHFTKESINK
jgi:hypothetical protein